MDDPVDARLAAAVSHDPRATLAQLSERVGLSTSAVQARLRRLESTGVITGYRALPTRSESWASVARGSWETAAASRASTGSSMRRTLSAGPGRRVDSPMPSWKPSGK